MYNPCLIHSIAVYLHPTLSIDQLLHFMDFRQQLASIRRREKVTQKELAKRMGVHLNLVSQFERYQHGLGYDNLLKYVHCLGYKLILVEKEFVQRTEDDLDLL